MKQFLAFAILFLALFGCADKKDLNGQIQPAAQIEALPSIAPQEKTSGEVPGPQETAKVEEPEKQDIVIEDGIITEQNQQELVQPQIPTEQRADFVIEADDEGFYPSTLPKIQKDQNISILFKVRSEGVYYAGLWIKSRYFDTGTLRKGEQKIIDFIAQDSFTITSYWPSSGVQKASLKAEVE